MSHDGMRINERLEANVLQIALVRIALACILIMFVSTVAPGPRLPFTGRLALTLVSDSVWDHCELTASVNQKGDGSQTIGCRSDEGKSLFEVKESLSREDVARLRQMLRGADPFQGHFWGQDQRGLDLPLVTLTVSDESALAMLVCSGNDSFDAGERSALLGWLMERIQAQRRKSYEARP